MEQKSPFMLARQLQVQLNGQLNQIDLQAVSRDEANLVETIKRQIGELRLDTRDYELSETRAEQLENAATSKKRLDEIRKNILVASEYNIFSSIDVAHIGAQLDMVASNLN